MALETATYLDSLVSSNPAGTDDKSDGDNHLRLIKSVLQNTFPNADQAFRLQHGKLKVKSSGSLALTDEGYMMVLTGSLRAVTLPASAPVGFQIGIKRAQDSGAVTKVSAPSGENIGDDGVDLVSSKYELEKKGDYAWFVKNATSGDEWVVTRSSMSAADPDPAEGILETSLLLSGNVNVTTRNNYASDSNTPDFFIDESVAIYGVEVETGSSSYWVGGLALFRLANLLLKNEGDYGGVSSTANRITLSPGSADVYIGYKTVNSRKKFLISASVTNYDPMPIRFFKIQSTSVPAPGTTRALGTSLIVSGNVDSTVRYAFSTDANTPDFVIDESVAIYGVEVGPPLNPRTSRDYWGGGLLMFRLGSLFLKSEGDYGVASTTANRLSFKPGSQALHIGYKTVGNKKRFLIATDWTNFDPMPITFYKMI